MKVIKVLSILLLAAGLIGSLIYSRGSEGRTAEISRQADTSASVLVKFQCGRCHGSPEEVPERQSCVGCHQSILAGRLDDRYSLTKTSKWKRNIQHLLWVPELSVSARRLRPAWVRNYLRSPHKIRPNLGSDMPGLPLSEHDIDDIIRELWPELPNQAMNETSSGSPIRGAKLLQEKGCYGCHEYSRFIDSGSTTYDLDTPLYKQSIERQRAPDLRFARDRMSTESLRTFIANPKSLDEKTAMPRIILNPTEIEDLVSAITRLPIEVGPVTPLSKFSPIVDRPITYEMVSSRVLRRVCWHCHSDPAGNKGDGGPGNTGGFGYSGTGLDLGTYSGVMRGSVRRPEEERSVIKSDAEGVPKLVSHMIARHAEVRGITKERGLGMPLGLPPVPKEDIELVWGWIVQGAPE